MSRTVSREWAITRIQTIISLCRKKDYVGIERISGEDDNNTKLFDFVDEINRAEIISQTDVTKYTNSMLETVVDGPYFREYDDIDYVVVNHLEE